MGPDHSGVYGSFLAQKELLLCSQWAQAVVCVSCVSEKMLLQLNHVRSIKL